MEESKRKYTVREDYEPKIRRLIKMLKADEQRSVKELAQFFEVTERQIYYMVDEVNNRGYRVSRNRGVPRMQCFIDQVGNGEVYLSGEEADLLLYIIHHLAVGNPQRQSLTSSLGHDLKAMLQPYFCHVDEDLSKVSRIAEALRSRRQMIIRGYRSSHSGTIADRRVEPVQWSANYRQLHAYDVEKRAMRTFVVNRMEGVELCNEKFLFESEHEVPEIDCFWMSGEPREVTLRMSLMALNLLHEEFPLSRQYEVRETGDGQHPYEVTLTVRSDKGLGRFVRGLGEENVSVATGEA